MHINDLLKVVVETGASDLHLKVGAYPMMRQQGALLPITDEKRLSHEDTVEMAATVMTTAQKQKFKDTQEVDLAYSVSGLGRFPCTFFSSVALSVWFCASFPCESNRSTTCNFRRH